MKIQEVTKENWDYLIILDACRFDFFKKNYKKHLKGKLKKRKSKASNTREWLSKNFLKKYDFTYISTNPYINNLGISLRNINPIWWFDWNPKSHFRQIIDAWDKIWNENFGTVHPSDLTEYVLNNFESIKGERTIIHYMQPHRPYLDKSAPGSGKNRKKKIDNLRENNLKIIVKRYLRFIFKKIWYKFSIKTRVKFKKLLDLKLTFWEKMYMQDKLDEVKKYYTESLNITLKNLKRLIKKLNGKIVLTADHGEAFGEHRVLGHPSATHTKELIEVPWFIIKKSKKKSNLDKVVEELEF